MIEEIRPIKNDKIKRDNAIKLLDTETHFSQTADQKIMSRYFRLTPFRLFYNSDFYNCKIIFDYFLKPSFLLLNKHSKQQLLIS